MMKSVWVLLLYLPATVFAQTALDNWYGEWTAHYSGGDSGTCSITIDFSTTTQAAVSGSCVSDNYPITNLVSVQIASNGSLTLTSGTSSTGAQFTGTLQGTSDSGQWVNSFYGISGTWTMSKLSSQTTVIVASGIWNVARLDPSCNYTDTGTFNVSHANGAYSATIDFSSHHIGPDCQNQGAEGGMINGFFASSQDMLTASQFQAMLKAFVASAGDDGSVQPVSFTSPDNVSFTEIFPSGHYVNVQMTRVAPTPTSYALAVTSAGSGYGSVTSSPAGISCYAPEPGINYLVAPDCSESYAGGISVSLTATPAGGSYFYGWSGACTGTGSCVVTMDATRNVTATFKPKPFVADTIFNYAPGFSPSPPLVLTTTITFDTPNLGKQGAVYVTAWVPVNGLGALGILSAPMSHALSVTTTRDNPYLGGEIGSRQEAFGTLLAAADTNAFVLVQLTSTGWQLVVSGQLIPYASGVLGNALASLNILNNTNNPSNLLGAQFCVGYGTSAAEMIAAGRMMPVAIIPGATAATSGSCDVTDIVVEFYNTNLDHYFITADSSEAAQIDSGSAGPGWSRTGNSFKSGGSTSVCRFYGSQSPGPNSHFYTVDPAECQGLKDQQIPAGDPRKLTEKSWNYESLDFVSTPPVSGACPAGTTPVYRAYNNGFSRGVDSNHRITGSSAAIQEVVNRGWSNEGVVMCAPN